MNYEIQQGEVLVSTDKTRLDRDLIHSVLSNIYWAKGIPRKTLERALENSLCFGVYVDSQQVGFARVVSDFATFGYLSDVFIVEEFRSEGLGTMLIDAVMNHPDLQGLRRFSLATRDASRLYSKFGFRKLRNPERHMEIFRDGLYQDGMVLVNRRQPESKDASVEEQFQEAFAHAVGQ